MKIVALTLVSLIPLASAWGVTTNSYDRYQSIVDRQMFGPLPPNFDPTKSPGEVQKATTADAKELTQKQEQIKKAIHFMAINRDSDGSVRVGFSDQADPKIPMTYYVKVGEQAGPWTVRSADVDTAMMTIVNGEGVEVTLKLGGNSASDASAVSTSGAVASSAPNARAANLFGGSLRLRRQRREELERAKDEAEAKAREEREAMREKERAEERAERQAQLQSIEDELRRVREEREAAKEKSESENKEKGGQE